MGFLAPRHLTRFTDRLVLAVQQTKETLRECEVWVMSDQLVDSTWTLICGTFRSTAPKLLSGIDRVFLPIRVSLLTSSGPRLYLGRLGK
jgi:hypothetical protein